MNTNYLYKSNFSAFLRHLILIPALFLSFIWGGTTDKITGRITDKETGEPLIGCNIIVIEEGLGAATDLNGYYYILNIPPGTYIVKSMMIGYTNVSYTNVIVNADFTTTIDFQLSIAVIAGEEITVEEMTHRFIGVHKMDKSKVAAAIAKSTDRTIMFTRTKVMADRLVGDLSDFGVTAAPIHGDLRQTSREKSLRDFGNGKLEALVATDVAARGIHVDDIDIVIQYDPPSDHKNYVHRAGRTARAGESGLVVTLSLWDEELDIKRLQKRIDVIQPITEMFSNDERLNDLAGWDPLAD